HLEFRNFQQSASRVDVREALNENGLGRQIAFCKHLEIVELWILLYRFYYTVQKSLETRIYGSQKGKFRHYAVRIEIHCRSFPRYSPIFRVEASSCRPCFQTRRSRALNRFQWCSQIRISRRHRSA